jgi:hypothetical protein
MAEAKMTGWFDGWEVRGRADGSFAVYDDHGMMAGPFGTERAAIQTALMLPKRFLPDPGKQKDLLPRHLRVVSSQVRTT